MPIIPATDPGTSFTNRTDKILWQYICQWKNSCGLCIQFSNRVGTYWPLPMHIGCNCVQVAIRPGDTADPYIDFQEEIHKLLPQERARVVGVSNWTLIDKKIVRWEDVVTKARIKDFREVVAEQDLSVKRLVKAGVSRAVAEKAHSDVRTPAQVQAERERKALIRALRGHGLTDDQIRAALSGRLGARIASRRGPELVERPWLVGKYGPSGGPLPPPKPKPPPPPPKPIPRPKPKPPPKPSVRPVAPSPALVPPVSPVVPPKPPGEPSGAVLERYREMVRTGLERARSERDRLSAEMLANMVRSREIKEEIRQAESQFKPTAHLHLENDRLTQWRYENYKTIKALETRVDRFESWRNDRASIPNLLPPIPIAERLTLYTAGDAKVNAINRLSGEYIAINNQIADRRLDLRAQWTELKRRVDLGGPKVTQADRDRVNEMAKELGALKDKYVDVVAKVRERLGEVLDLDPERRARIIEVSDPSADPAMVEKLREAASFLRGKLARGDGEGFTLAAVQIPAHENQRAYYSVSDDKSIHLTVNGSAQTAVHEAGHAIDDLMRLSGKGAGISTVEYLDHRVGNENPRALSEVFPNHGYRSTEIGRKDRFEELFGQGSTSAWYAGKKYPSDEVSEILAMGLEQLYKDPVTFAKKDPEYLKFVLGILDGSLR